MILRAIATLLAAGLETAAIACWFGPGTFNAGPDAAWQLHIAAALLFSLIAAISFPGAREIFGRLLFWFTIFLFAVLIPGAGLVAAVAFVAILSSRPRPRPEDAFSLESPLDRLREAPATTASLPRQDPLVLSLKTRPIEEIRKLVLGMRDLRDSRSTAILKTCQQHSDHHVQLLAKGIWSDRVEILEGFLDKLQQNRSARPLDQNRLATAQVCMALAEERLLPDEEIKTCCLDGITACDEGLAESPASTGLLVLKTRFLLMLRLPGQARGVFRKLDQASLPADELAPLELEIHYQSGGLRQCAEAFRRHRALPGALGEAQRFWTTPASQPQHAAATH